MTARCRFPEALACPENLEGEIALSDHPLIRETMKDVLTEALDIEGLQGVLTDMPKAASVPRRRHPGAVTVFPKS